MYIGIAILTNTKIHNLAREIVFNLNQKYCIGTENALLPQHISLKQSFPYEGDIEDIEEFLENFCSNLRPIKILLEKIEMNLINENTILGWIKVKESSELRAIHIKLCEALKSEFNIEPLGFDGNEWAFHQTLTASRVNKNLINKIVSDYFSLKIFDLG